MNYKDQLGKAVILPGIPKKIISLVPSQTELLFDLGLNEEVAGITKFCIHPPEWYKNKTRIGGTKNINTKKIKELNPDLIIANKEENVKEQIEELEKHFPVWTSDVNNLDDALDMIISIGAVTAKERAAQEIATSIRKKFSKLNDDEFYPYKTVYLIWKDPYMTVGGDTFIHNMLENAGLHNVFITSTRYPEVTVKDLKENDTELILLSSEPYPFKEKHIEELQEQLPEAKILLVDGEMFSWYGSRLLKAPAYFLNLRKQLDL
ncbi:MAG: iron transporter [Chitinophagaceae bacterium]|nr:iron transporter [Chitinophagaceae bacterium]